MEYTKDLLYSIKYKNNQVAEIKEEKHNVIKKFIKWLERDEYFTAVILTSIIVLLVDFFILKKFIEIIELIP